jgi:hypothetical protein
MNIITNIAAWWGAVIATFLIIWDIYKWKHSGSIINVTASPNMQAIGNFPNHEGDKDYISIIVTNTGNIKTTITHLVIFYYKYKPVLSKILKKKAKTFFVPAPFFSPPLPLILEPGERWLCGIEQTNEWVKLSRNGLLYCGIYHSGSKKPVMQRVVIHKDN